MLLSFRVANHRSLREEQQIDLTPVYDADRPTGTRWEAVPVAGIFGANASGKSNLLQALAYLRFMVLNSDRIAEPGQGIVRDPFALAPDAARELSWYALDISIDGVRHTYGVSLGPDGVEDEWLYQYPRNRRRIVFHRTGQNYRYGVNSSPLRRPAVEEVTPPNILFLSTASRFDQLVLQPVYQWFRDLIVPPVHVSTTQFRPTSVASDLDLQLSALLADEQRRRQVLALLKVADFGIEDIGFEAAGVTLSTTTWRVWFGMKGSRSTVRMYLADQSAGTRTFLTYLPDVLTAVERGTPLVVDELESNLHPRLAEQVVKLFQDPRANPRRAQLIFTSHNASLLSSNDEILKRDQVWFVEKSTEDGSSAVFPLSAFKPRLGENTERRYLGGSYGAVPFVDAREASAVFEAVAAQGQDGE